MRRLTLLLATISLLGQSSIAAANAQAPSPSLVGERVRVTVPTRVLVGQLVSIEADHLLLTEESGEPAEVALSDVERLELSLGHHRHMGKGALIGGLAGAAVGAVAGAIEESQCTGDFLCFGAGGGAIFGGLAGGGLGAVLGLAIGAAVKTERWSEVSSQRWGFIVRPRGGLASGGGVEIGFRLGM